LTPAFWHFQLPKTPPTEISLKLKKKLEKKKVIKTTPQKKKNCAGPLAPKKKVGVEQEKVAQVILESA
jgi:hypothetical protein